MEKFPCGQQLLIGFEHDTFMMLILIVFVLRRKLLACSDINNLNESQDA